MAMATGIVALATARKPEAPAPATSNKANSRQGQALTAVCLAVAVGFEPTVGVTPHNISSVAPSAARTRHREKRYPATLVGGKSGLGRTESQRALRADQSSVGR